MKMASAFFVLASKTTAGEDLPAITETNELMWKAARATGAAPSYFPAMDRFLDGGLACNNPTLGKCHIL